MSCSVSSLRSWRAPDRGGGSGERRGLGEGAGVRGKAALRALLSRRCSWGMQLLRSVCEYLGSL